MCCLKKSCFNIHHLKIMGIIIEEGLVTPSRWNYTEHLWHYCNCIFISFENKILNQKINSSKDTIWFETSIPVCSIWSSKLHPRKCEMNLCSMFIYFPSEKECRKKVRAALFNGINWNPNRAYQTGSRHNFLPLVSFWRNRRLRL